MSTGYGEGENRGASHQMMRCNSAAAEQTMIFSTQRRFCSTFLPNIKSETDDGRDERRHGFHE